MELAQVRANGNAVTDVVTEARPDVDAGFVVIGTCCLVAQHIVAEVRVAGTGRDIRIPGFILAGKVIEAVQSIFFKVATAIDVLPIGIRLGIDAFHGPVGVEAKFRANAQGAGFTEVALVVKQLEAGKRVQVNGLLAFGECGGRKGCRQGRNGQWAHDIHAEPPVQLSL